MKKLHCRVENGHLVPLTPDDQEKLVEYDKATVEFTPKLLDLTRDKSLRRLFMVVGAVMKAHEGPWADQSDLIDACKLKLGMVKVGHRFDGGFFARVISTRDMTRQQIANLHDGTIKLLSDRFGYDIQTLLPPPETFVGGRTEDEPEERQRTSSVTAATVPDSEPPLRSPSPQQSNDAQPLRREMVSKQLAVAVDPNLTTDDKVQILMDRHKDWLAFPETKDLSQYVTDVASKVAHGNMKLADAKKLLGAQI